MEATTTRQKKRSRARSRCFAREWKPRRTPRRTRARNANASGAFYLTLVPIRPRRRGERLSLRTLPVVSLRPLLPFNPRPRRLSTPPDAFQLHPDIIASYGTTLRERLAAAEAAPARDVDVVGTPGATAGTPARQHQQNLTPASASVHDFILRAAEDAAAARGLLSSAKGSRGGGAADVARKIETAVAEAEASWREEMTDLTRAHALELEETREETREARRRAEEAIARAEEAEEKIEDATSTVAATAALEDAMSLVEATRAKLAAAKESEARAIASRDAAEAAAEAERDARGELAAERARLRSELERASATSRDLESALRDARDATKRAVDDAVAAFKESNPPPPDVLTLASMREELDAMRRVAEIQEREVVRATAAAAESAAAGGLDAAAAAASVPQALLERWRGEVFRLLLQLRQDPIVAKEEARIAAR